MTIKRKEGSGIEEITKNITHNKNGNGYNISRVIIPNKWVKELDIKDKVKMQLDTERKQITIKKGE